MMTLEMRLRERPSHLRCGLPPLSAILVLCLGACAGGPQPRLGEVRFRKPTAGTVDRYAIRPQRLAVDVQLHGRVTERVELWIADLDGERRTENTVVRSIPADGALSVDVPLVGLDGKALPGGCYRLHMQAYEDDAVQHGGDSCIIDYGGPDTTSRAVQCAEPSRKSRCHE